MKYINFKSYKLNSIYKNILVIPKNILVILKKMHFFFRNIDFKKYNFIRIYKYSIYKKKILYFIQSIYLRKFSLIKIYRRIKYDNIKYIPLFLLAVTSVSTLIYLSIPKFYNYNKLNIQDKLCKQFSITCSINGDLKYNIFPTPRLILKNFTVNGPNNINKNFIEAENVIVKLSFYNLLNKKKHSFKKIELKKSNINLDLEKIKKYTAIFEKKFSFTPILISNSKFNFLQKDKRIASIRNTKITYHSNKNKSKAILNGDIVGDKINIQYINSKSKDNSEKKFIFKLVEQNLLVKINLLNNQTLEKIDNGKILFKLRKNKLMGFFDYKDNKIIVKNSNIRNLFLDGKLNGEIEFLPFFNFNLNLDLNSLNFSRLYTLLISLDDEGKRNLFKINKKINGNLNLSIDKIFSKNTIINSLESRTKFLNGSIKFDNFLLNLGKLGAADFTGAIINDKKFSNLRFEKNIYIDDSKRFFNKFGVFNRENKPNNFFVSGNFDLVNLVLRLGEISTTNNLKQEEVNYVEKEFNNFLLEDGYESLFNFLNLKEFVKSVSSEFE